MRTALRWSIVIVFAVLVGPFVAAGVGIWQGLDAWTGATLTLWKRLK